MSAELLATPSGLGVRRTARIVPNAASREALIDALGTRRGLLLRCNFTFPGRYRPAWTGFADPPLEIALQGDRLAGRALTANGRPLLAALRRVLDACPATEPVAGAADALTWRLHRGGIVAVLKAIVAGLALPGDRHWGLFGPLGFDLAFDALGLDRQRARPADQRDLVLYIPDRLLVAEHGDHPEALEISYGFEGEGADLPLAAPEAPAPLAAATDADAPGAFAARVRAAVEACARGALFEVVLGQTFRRRTGAGPDRLFRMLDRINPSPYEFLANLGQGEALVGASPEMFVRVEGSRVESCPISGTLRRGADAVADAARVQELLGSEKAAAELTMCTDIDRNDKAAVCEPGSIRVIGRRQIETYSHLLHTVDHVEGRLRAGKDAIDALAAHVWAVTLTGAPREAAISFIEAHEPEPRRWYGGAIGRIGFDGRLDTGIVLRSIRLAHGIAEMRVGATILHSSVPEDEEQETEVKAQALLKSIDAADAPAVLPPSPAAAPPPMLGTVTLADRGSPFAALLRQMVLGAGAAIAEDATAPLILAPGADDAALATATEIARQALQAGRPLLGIGHGCLAVAAALGARIGPAKRPVHGDSILAEIRDPASPLFRGVAAPVALGCYHRLAIADLAAAPLVPVLAGPDGLILAVQHRSLKVAGLLFQPESLLTAQGDRIIANGLRWALSP